MGGRGGERAVGCCSPEAKSSLAHTGQFLQLETGLCLYKCWFQLTVQGCSPPAGLDLVQTFSVLGPLKCLITNQHN